MNHHLGLKFNCGSCSKSFRSKASLEKHFQDTHPIDDDNKCQGAVQDSDSEDDLQEDQITKSAPKRVSNGSFEAYDMCDSIELKYYDDDASEEITDVIVKSKTEEKECEILGEPGFNCQVCAEPFESVNDLRDHYLFDHLKVKYDCKLCTEQFANQKELSKHQKTYHFEYFLKNKGFFYCQFCEWWSAQNASVVKHMISDHLNILPQCHGCQQTFSSASKLDLHKKESSCVQPTKIEGKDKAAEAELEQKPDQEIQLGNEHEQKPDQEIQLGNDHEQKPDQEIQLENELEHKPDQDIQLEKDDQIPNVEQEAEAMDDDVSDEGIDDSIDTIDNGKNCQICHKSVPNLTKHYLVDHLFWKIDYDCYYCGEIFTSFAQLTRHNQLEHKGMPTAQACHLCQAKFTRKNDLVTHLLTVHLKLEFQCEICGKNYNSQSNLLLHEHLKHYNK